LYVYYKMLNRVIKNVSYIQSNVLEDSQLFKEEISILTGQ